MATAKHTGQLDKQGRQEHLMGSQPRLHQQGVEIQRFGDLRRLPIALSHDARLESCQLLNRILADTIILYNLYKKHPLDDAGPDLLSAPSASR